MASRKSACPDTLDLLSWSPPPVEHRYEDEAVTRAATLHGRLCRAMRVTLDAARERGLSREDVAARMSEFLGEEYSAARLNADTAESKETHVINAVRLMAFVNATGDSRIISLIAEPAGLAVVDRKWLPAIEAALLEQHEAEIAERRRRAQAAVRRAMSWRPCN